MDILLIEQVVNLEAGILYVEFIKRFTVFPLQLIILIIKRIIT